MRIAAMHEPARAHHASPIAIYYEHPEWFTPLFAELDRRGIAYDRLLAHAHQFDPSETIPPYKLLVNRMSPSAYLRGHLQAISYTLQYLAHLQAIGANVLNGYEAYVYEFSKARQIGLLQRLGLRYPRTRVINDSSQASSAATGLIFPVILKPNIGGSGAKIVKFNSPDELEQAAAAGALDLGIDHTALIQEYLPAEGDSIIRVEVLGGEYLYAIRIFLSAGQFNLCPADYCQVPAQVPYGVGISNGEDTRRAAPVEGYTPPPPIIDAVKRLTAAAHIEVGGVEYLVSARDGQVYYYDVNALSNFVADAQHVVGFDPFARFVDYLLKRAGMERPVGATASISLPV
jgi:hypothetical protein